VVSTTGDPATHEEEEVQDPWRSVPGYVIEVLNGVPPCPFCHSRFSQYQVLLGSFIFSQNPSPLTDKPLFGARGFEWGLVPLEKVVYSPELLERLALSPFASRNSVSIIEPCQFVGYNCADGRGVRASKNVAYQCACPFPFSGVCVSTTFQ